MGFVLSLIVFAVGAVLKWAVTTDVSGVDLGTVGVILMVVGIIGFVLALVQWMGWWHWRERSAAVRTRRVEVREDPPSAP